MAYIDTSVLVAYYFPEPLSKAAQREVGESETPTISPLTEVEFCSALALKVRAGEMSTESVRRILASFRVHRTGGGYRIVPIGAREYAAACEWLEAFSTPLRAVDALHLAAAFSNGLRLVTADNALARSARHFGVKHKLVS